MSNEQGFLDAIRTAPADEVNRLVYADWLEEQGDPRGQYLRLELELARLEPSDPRYAETELDLRVCRRMLHPLWVHEVSRAYDLVLLEYERTMKIPCVKRIRELTWIGLAEAKALSEALPAVVLSGVSRLQAERGRDQFHAIDNVRTVVRISTSADRPPPLLPPEQEGHALILVRYPNSWQEQQSMAVAIRGMRRCSPEEAQRLVGLNCPVPLHVFSTEEEANRAKDSFPFPDAVGVWPVHHYAVIRFEFSSSNEAGSIVLHDYPWEWTIRVIRCVREMTGLGLAEAKSLVESPRPVTLLRAVTPEKAQQLLRQFSVPCVVRFEREA
jgi:uncharacterized protein (TIGR02996 family)